MTTHCAGSETTGIPAEKVFAFADRYYTISKSGYDLYFRVAGITGDDRAHLEFSASPFATGLARRRDARKPARKEVSMPGPAGRTFLANGRQIRGRGD